MLISRIELPLRSYSVQKNMGTQLSDWQTQKKSEHPHFSAEEENENVHEAL